MSSLGKIFDFGLNPRFLDESTSPKPLPDSVVEPQRRALDPKHAQPKVVARSEDCSGEDVVIGVIAPRKREGTFYCKLKIPVCSVSVS